MVILTGGAARREGDVRKTIAIRAAEDVGPYNVPEADKKVPRRVSGDQTLRLLNFTYGYRIRLGLPTEGVRSFG